MSRALADRGRCHPAVRVLVVSVALGLVACGPGEVPVRPESGEGPTVEADVPTLPDGFQRGMNLEPIAGFGTGPELERLPATYRELRSLGIDHVALIPSFFQPDLDDSEFTWKGGRKRVEADTRRAIRSAHEAGLRVLLKPHLWLEDRSGGAWRGDILPGPESWPAWSAAYREVVVSFAVLAAEEEVAGISIGSELTELALARPDFWRSLTADVQAVFPGLITYAANWDREVEAIEWWDAVDLIGVDAFWPLQREPDEILTTEALDRRLGEIRDRLEAVSHRFERPVLITELGYRSAVGAGYRPWEWSSDVRGVPDLELQSLLYVGIARSMAPAAEAGWLRGLYFWVWSSDPRWGGPGNTDFTPRGKPAADLIAVWFGRR